MSRQQLRQFNSPRPSANHEDLSLAILQHLCNDVSGRLRAAAAIRELTPAQRRLIGVLQTSARSGVKPSWDDVSALEYE